jgi:SAM-dependent methyltransferase
MSNQSVLQQFQEQLTESITSSQFVKASLGNYAGNEKELKNIYVKRVKIKRSDMLSFNYRYKTRDIFKNFPVEEGVTKICQQLSNDFKICTLFTTEKEVILEHRNNGDVVLRESKSQGKVMPELTHDKEKKRIIVPQGKSYLHELKLTDQDGHVFKNAQDKFKQINQYIQILGSLIADVDATKIRNVVDMGSGKGYLTFALYDYLHEVLKLDAVVTGVEFRQDLVSLCNTIAGNAKFDKLKFVEGTIEAYPVNDINLLIALHACDTATDDAIYKGIKANADLIVVAPCCHKQIRREMEASKVKNEISFLTKYGIFLERQAEMVTDGIRALVLEQYGYKTKVFEFISDAHTPKNVLVVGIKVKSQHPAVLKAKREAIQLQIDESKAYFGIGYHHLERLLQQDQ